VFAAVELIHGGFSRFTRTTSSPRRPHMLKPTTSRAVTFAFTTLQMATARATSTSFQWRILTAPRTRCPLSQCSGLRLNVEGSAATPP